MDLNVREVRLKIARAAYKEVLYAIHEWENSSGFDVCCHWDECITVDDQLFHGPELRGER